MTDSERAETAARFATWLWMREHNPIEHRGELRCETCGRASHQCECVPDVLRFWRCLGCGFRIGTGGLSIASMLIGKPQ